MLIKDTLKADKKTATTLNKSKNFIEVSCFLGYFQNVSKTVIGKCRL
ncbi:Hypothetical protein LOCK900_1798 [Lacticaseibacillus rhamnosus LOCK900]|nr:Hypothetical protein LOCK900_1798 [Lacticaseibacillus rhamnosus LOCK900]